MARPSIGDHHAEWLSLVETSGPFLTVPALKRALPDGLDAVPPAMGDLRVAHAEWREDPGLQQRWVRWVLDDLLELRDAVTEATDADPTHRVAEHNVTLRPSYVVRDGSVDGNPAVLLIHRVDTGVALNRAIPGDAWAASPIDRAAELARASGVPLALVTDGSRWTLVWARQGETTGMCTWRTELFLEEPITVRAFATLLGARRFFNLPVEEGLAALLQESAGKQQEVADQLGSQVRRAVELLIATLDRKDRDRHGELLQDLAGAEVYRGAVTVMMRLVFLFVAEERELLPIGNPFYAETLAASTLRGQLQERADRAGESPLEHSEAAWHRILALFRVVHGGIEHDALRLPAYGGGLFDPDRYPYLEGRPGGTAWNTDAAHPLPVDDRTMLHLLDALQTLEQGGARVQLSYRALDVEQIGHVYEGLLDHTAVRITDAALALGGKHEPEIALGDLNRWTGDDVLVDRLAKETGRSAKAIEKSLDAEITDHARARLRAACGADEDLLARVEPFHGLLREDLRGDPLVFLPGSLYVTQALDRRASGTYYTPRQLAEEVVQHALDPAVFNPGPAQEKDRDKWVLRPAHELLDLKVADIAMGSGAFLVAACRYLAARLQEAWGKLGPGEWTVFGQPRDGAGVDALPADPLEQEQVAYRLVAERCLYGVDKNPMAVEMAKLSLWLITLAKDKPFSFVDHALRSGDSLLGITNIRQLRVAHLDPEWPRQATLDLGFEEIEGAVDRALGLRRELEAFVVGRPEDAERKAELLRAADEALDDARLLGDLIVGAALAQRDDSDPLVATNVARHVRVMLDTVARDDDRFVARSDLRALADDWLVERRAAVGAAEAVEWADRDPFHWALEFPEVRARGGFDVIVGNPPFQGGKKISGATGIAYRSYLVAWLAGGVRGNADLVAFFFLRAEMLLGPGSGAGLIATNTLAEGDTREVGLDQLTGRGTTIFRAVASQPWPGAANLEMATVWARRGAWLGGFVLDGRPVASITPSLGEESRVRGNALRLASSQGRAFIGSFVNGIGFVLNREEAANLVVDEPESRAVVRPFLSGEDLTSRSDSSPSRWIIDFRDWPIEKAERYPTCLEIVRGRVKPKRDKLGVSKKRVRENWWRFEHRASGLYEALTPLERCIALTLHSKAVQPGFVPTSYVFSHGLAVIASDDDRVFGTLASGVHWWWAVTRGSTLETRVRFTPSDCFETFVQPTLTDAVGNLGGRLNEHRTALMLDRQEGLTKTYNRVHDPDERADDIVRLRELHVELDHAVRDAYGWSDLELGHDFHETKFGVRYTFAPVPRQEVLDLLMELNHARYADEVRKGLHSKPKAKGRKKSVAAGAMTFGLDDV
ncbi:MAG: type IIL restriction-modification enzyme MmeI [Solirubrobacteraceae bacterium]